MKNRKPLRKKTAEELTDADKLAILHSLQAMPIVYEKAKQQRERVKQERLARMASLGSLAKGSKVRRDLKKNLFYSPAEKLLFWVAGYDGSSENVNDLIKMLGDKALLFANACFVHRRAVQTTFVTSSMRYKDMRVFYVKCDYPPKEAFSLGIAGDWTMDKWLKG